MIYRCKDIDIEKGKKYKIFYSFNIITMIKAFELTMKVGVIPVFSLPHIDQGILAQVKACKKFQDYVQSFDRLEEGTLVSKIEILGVEMFGKEKVGFVNMRAVT